jgi:hypothetical protein
MAQSIARKKIVKEAGAAIDELEEQVAQVRRDREEMGCSSRLESKLDDEN